jgi:hypothetical protein
VTVRAYMSPVGDVTGRMSDEILVILDPDTPLRARSSYFSHSALSMYGGTNRVCSCSIPSGVCPLLRGLIMLCLLVVLGGKSGTALRGYGRSSRDWPFCRRGMAGDTPFSLGDRPCDSICPGGPPLATISSTSPSSVTVVDIRERE